MLLEGPLDAYRFVVVYRSERRGSGGGEPTWRGWVEQVYPTPENAAAPRLWFEDVEEVSALIAQSISDTGDPTEPRDA